VKCLSGRREFDPPFRPTKQAGAEFILEAPYLLAQRRLRDVKPRGRAAEVQLFGNGEKGAEVSQLHPGMISRTNQSCPNGYWTCTLPRR
jgi:hypothetical protein